MKLEWAESFLKKIQSKHILVAGEIGLDEYVWGETTRISPEAPVPVIEVEHSSLKLGMAANVAQNIISLGARSTLISVVGADENGKTIEGLMDKSSLTDRVLITDPTRPTLRKMRVIAGKQHVVRVDYEKNHPLNPDIAREFRKAVEDRIAGTDGIIVQDYGKGLWTPEVMLFAELARRHRRPIFVDPCRHNPPALYKHCALMSPNVLEAQTMVGNKPRSERIRGNDDPQLKELAGRLLDESQAENVVITCGADGMISLSHDRKNFFRIPTYALEAFDVTGAGDTVISVLSLAQVIGLPLWRSMQIANAAAGIVVGRIGAGCVSPAELSAELHRLSKIGLLTSPTEPSPAKIPLQPSL